MIQFTSHPYPCCFSKNPIPFTIHASHFSSEISIFPSITLTLNYQLLEGRIFYFKYVNPDTGAQAEARFIGKTNPELDGYEVPANATGAQAVNFAYVENVAKYIKADRELSSYYTVETNGLDIIIKAKQAVESLIPNFFNLNDDTGGGLGDSIEAEISKVFWKASIRDGHRVNLKVYFEKEYMSNEFEVVSSQTDKVDENGNLTIDIASIIDSEIRNSFIDPPLAESTDPNAVDKTQKGKVLRRFYIEASEVWRNMLPNVTWQKSETRFAHFGGVSMDDYSRENPMEYIVAEKMTLSWWPTKKRLYEEQKDWLSYMNLFGVLLEATAKLKILYKDGTNDILSLGTQNLNPWETITVPVGYEQLNVAVIQDLNKEVFGWEITFENADEEEIAKKKYLLVQSPNIFTKTLVYLNSFGVPESFVTTGFWDNNITTNSQLATKTLSHDYKSINGQDFVFSRSSRNMYEARSGLLYKKEMKALKDLLNVSPVFLIENGLTYPVIIETGNFKINQEEDVVGTLDFQIAKSMQLSNVSEMIKKPTLRLEENCGMFTVYVVSDETIGVFNDLEVFKDEDTLFDTVAHDGTKYVLANKIEDEAFYKFSVQVEIQGVIFDLVENIQFYPEKAMFMSPDHDQPANVTVFELESTVNENVTIDLETGNEITAALVADDLTVLGGVVTKGIKEHSIEASCLSRISEFRIYDQEYFGFQLEKIINLKVLEISNCTLSGPFSISAFKQLETVILNDNNISDFEFGIIRNLSSVNLENNNLFEISIENLVRELWTYRKLFTPTGAYLYVYLAGNPGIASITNETLAMINGTGAYAADGLVQNNILIIY